MEFYNNPPDTPSKVKDVYSREEVIRLLKEIYKLPIAIELNFNCSPGNYNIYPGSWKFKYPEDLIKKLTS